jgi:hypothetical protein
MKGSVLVVPDSGSTSMFRHKGQLTGLGTRLLDHGFLPVDAEIVGDKIRAGQYRDTPVIGVGHGGVRAVEWAQEGLVAYPISLHGPIGDMERPPSGATSIFDVHEELARAQSHATEPVHVMDLFTEPAQEPAKATVNPKFTNIPIFNLQSPEDLPHSARTIENVLWAIGMYRALRSHSGVLLR